jgi:3-hydroxy acid dehydrogenase / malonic semialdehyde reductase
MSVFITGATAGFGATTVKQFVEHGHKVVATGRREERLQELKKEYGDKVHTVALDVRNKDDVFKVVKDLPKPFSEIDILINNAGLALGLEPAQRANIDDWQTMVDTNINGVLNCTTAILPQMVSRNKGHIINLGSVAGDFPYPGGNVYGATKAFVHQFSLNIRSDLSGTKVRVTNIEPGMCGGTEFSEVRYKGDKEKASAVYKGVEYLTSEDVAETIYWVASRPDRVNINTLSMMPVAQSFAGFLIHRK